MIFVLFTVLTRKTPRKSTGGGHTIEQRDNGEDKIILS